MAKRNGGRPIYYIEAKSLIDLIEHPADVEPARSVVAVITAATDREITLVTSVLTIAEVYKAKHEANGHVDPAVQERIDQLWHPDGSPIELVEVSELIAREANVLLRRGLENGWAKTKGADAIHIATALHERADKFVTNEQAMKKWGDLLGYKVCPAHEALPEPPPALGEQQAMFTAGPTGLFFDSGGDGSAGWDAAAAVTPEPTENVAASDPALPSATDATPPLPGSAEQPAATPTGGPATTDEPAKDETAGPTKSAPTSGGVAEPARVPSTDAATPERARDDAAVTVAMTSDDEPAAGAVASSGGQAAPAVPPPLAVKRSRRHQLDRDDGAAAGDATGA